MRRLALTFFLLLLAAPAAFGHAVVVETNPSRGASLDTAPKEVTIRFNEPVEGAFGAVRVFDANSKRVDEGKAIRPGGSDKSIGVRLKPGLSDGTYIATYRVVSADSHPISGGFVFAVGDGGTAGGPAVADLIGGSTGPGTEIGFGIARGLTYLATALLLGGLIFFFAVWRRAAPPAEARAGAARRARRVGLIAAAVGVLAGAAGIVFQGASATGTSFWSALDPDTIKTVLETRFGRVWLIRLVAFGLIGAYLLLARPVPERAAARELVGATQVFSGPPLPSLPTWLLLAPAAALLAFAPALGGHAAVAEPVAVLFPMDVIHVVAMSAWLGGLATLLLVVPSATRALAPPERSKLLARILLRFSPIALACVIALVATGVVQSILHIEDLDRLTTTPFGRAVLIKIGLLLVLIGFGVVQRRTIVPRLERVAEAGEPPGDTGRLLRRTLRSEVLVAVCVIGVTAALVSYPPPDSLAGGPFSTTEKLGPLSLEATVDPARVGLNELHIYLLDAKTGAPFNGTKELTVTSALESQDIGPVAAKPRRAGPGHYVVRGLQLVPGGKWKIAVTSRVSEFDQYSTDFTVKVE